MLKSATHHAARQRARRRWLLTFVAVLAACIWTNTHHAAAQGVPNAVTWPSLHLEEVIDDFSDPVNLISPRDGTNRLFVLERGGRIYIIQDGVRLAEPFLDISGKMHRCGECGLLGLAFPPDFADSGYFFINYTINVNVVDPPIGDDDRDHDQRIGDTIIARMRVSDDPNIADVTTEETVLAIYQPAANHNGGHILFGPDGNLYIGMGDGGGNSDTYHNGQDPGTLHGKILRITVGPTGTYTVPDDNPFLDNGDYLPEIWATGLRNPWRYGFDRVTGDLYVADVGEAELEEINFVAADDIGNGGLNFGWSIMEGDHCFPPSGAQDCERSGLIEPVVTYGRDAGCSIIGGHVYRSTRLNQAPIYLYADFCFGTVSAMQRTGDEWVTKQYFDMPFRITSLGEDEAGNIYLINYEGTIYRFVESAHAQFMPSIFGLNPEQE